jgi:biopolymer transport protein ExbB/TolQ
MTPYRMLTRAALLGPITLLTVTNQASAAIPATDTAWTHLGHAVQGAGPGLVPLAVLASWIGLHAVKRWRAYRASVLFPALVVRELEDFRGKPEVGQGQILPDMDRLNREIARNLGPLSRVVKASLAASNRPYSERKDDHLDAIGLEMGPLGRPNAVFTNQYVTSTLYGLVSAVVILVIAFSEASIGGRGASSRISAAIASAMVPTAIGAILAIIAKGLGDHFEKVHEVTREKFFRLTKPLIYYNKASQKSRRGPKSETGSVATSTNPRPQEASRLAALPVIPHRLELGSPRCEPFTNGHA